MAAESFPLSHAVGRGRSATVYAATTADGERLARKVFVPDTASRLVMVVTDGAPNPYGWSAHAIEAAIARRRVLRPLVQFWFGTKLRIPEQRGWVWNERHRANEMRNVFVEGRPVPLRFAAPASDAPDRLADLTSRVMAPLQAHLEAAGFDGLVWQAGRGNPVATSNFLLEDEEHGQFAWIDLESGVPALFSWSVREQARYYLPKALRYRPMFDDVDVTRLQHYLARKAENIDAACGPGTTARCIEDAEALDEHQRRWKGMRRIDRSILYAFRRGHLTADQARTYRKQPLRWNLFVARAGMAAAAHRAVRTLRTTGRWLANVRYGRLLRNAGRFMVSQRYRTHVAQRLVRARVRSWRKRGAVRATEAGALRRRLGADESSQYVTDFGVHLAIKPIVKALQWWVAPALTVASVLHPVALGAILVAGGAIGRTLYTLGRLLQAALRGERKPWIALGVGVLPVAGNAAYPIELLYCGAGEGRALARFLIYDVFAAAGRAVPIWGGSDTWTEHWFNRLPDRVPGLRAKAPEPE